MLFASEFMNNVVLTAKKLNKTIILPESDDIRILKAASYCNEENIANIILLGDEEKVQILAKENNINLKNIEIINPLTSSNYDTSANLLYELRKDKGITLEQAKEMTKIPNYFACLMIKQKLADGMVSGVNTTTADTMRPVLQIIKSRGSSKVSSVFFTYVNKKLIMLSDCAIIQNPTEEELADMAINSALTSLQFGIEPKVALLSYSTFGSGTGVEVDKVRNATLLAKEKLKSPELSHLNILIDGEMQADSALDENVAKKKAPLSNVAGQANVLIFPNLSSANIACKLLQRLANAELYGPVLQGLNAPINDMSRGASWEDLVSTIALTVLQTQK